MGNVYSVKSNDKVLIDLISNVYLEEDSFLVVRASQMELIVLKRMHTGRAKRALCSYAEDDDDDESMVRGFCDEMELLYQVKSPAFGTWDEGEQRACAAFKGQPLWPINVVTAERGLHGNYNYYYDIAADSSPARFDANNNDVDAYPAYSEQKVSSAMLHRMQYFEPKVYVTDHLYTNTVGAFVSMSNNVSEQTEPIDLSFENKRNLMAIKTTYNQEKPKTYFKPNAIPLPSNLNEASLIILKSVYDAKYHRKPNCDQIFREDPADPKLHVCLVCAKSVRSKWHHFQTHYSRNHKCSDCDAVYSRIDTLRTHAKKRHRTVIPRYYHGIPANVWHRVVIQSSADGPVPPKPPTPRPMDAADRGRKRHADPQDHRGRKRYH